MKNRLAPSQTNCAVGHIILAKFLHVSCMAKHSISSFIILLPFHFFRCLLLHFAYKLLIHPPAAFCSQAHLTKVRALFNQLGTDERSVITFRQHLGEQDSVSCFVDLDQKDPANCHYEFQQHFGFRGVTKDRSKDDQFSKSKPRMEVNLRSWL